MQLVEDHSAPVIALNIAYDVGSRNERKGLTGFAHLFEHMMFKGSQNVGDGEHFYQVFSNGGSMNGTTNADLTLYFETLPANQLELALFLEADRMRSLEIYAGEARQPASGRAGRAAPARRQSTVRPRKRTLQRSVL